MPNAADFQLMAPPPTKMDWRAATARQNHVVPRRRKNMSVQGINPSLCHGIFEQKLKLFNQLHRHCIEVMTYFSSGSTQ